jgi:hypothetical protein
MDALKKLRELALVESLRKYPSLPEYARISPKYNDKTANGLTRCIVDFIRLSGFQAERISCTGRIIDKSKIVSDCLGNQRRIGSSEWIKGSMQAGTADISATIAGKSVKIEVKIGRDKQRPAQIEYQKQIEAAGGVYFITTNFAQFFLWYNKLFITNPNRAKFEYHER